MKLTASELKIVYTIEHAAATGLRLALGHALLWLFTRIMDTRLTLNPVATLNPDGSPGPPRACAGCDVPFTLELARYTAPDHSGQFCHVCYLQHTREPEPPPPATCLGCAGPTSAHAACTIEGRGPYCGACAVHGPPTEPRRGA